MNTTSLQYNSPKTQYNCVQQQLATLRQLAKQHQVRWQSQKRQHTQSVAKYSTDLLDIGISNKQPHQDGTEMASYDSRYVAAIANSHLSPFALARLHRKRQQTAASRLKGTTLFLLLFSCYLVSLWGLVELLR